MPRDALQSMIGDDLMSLSRWLRKTLNYKEWNCHSAKHWIFWVSKHEIFEFRSMNLSYFQEWKPQITKSFSNLEFCLLRNNEAWNCRISMREFGQLNFGTEIVDFCQFRSKTFKSMKLFNFEPRLIDLQSMKSSSYESVRT